MPAEAAEAIARIVSYERDDVEESEDYSQDEDDKENDSDGT